MAALHDALKSLSPTTWDEVPAEDSALATYTSNIFSDAELICNSIPPPLSGTPFQDAKPQYSTPNEATGWKDMLPSSARAHPAHDEHESLQKNWGKAMKFSQKENPLGIAVYKMAGHDRHGAWFARRSVHEGMGFNRFKEAMLREFPESLKVQGGPGEGNVRGIGGDQRLERKDVDGVGRLEVYQLSAQFPGPTTPREFIELLLTTDHGMSDKSAAQLEDGRKHIPRSFMIVSKPVTHPEAPGRQGYIRGQYESVELIREIPITPAKSKSTSDLLDSHNETARAGRDRASTLAFTESRGPDAKGEQRDLHRASSKVPEDPELNPVEWMMLTRSDPGGGIPRFMVDRGTPSAMISDLHKWLDWAATLDTKPEEIDDVAQPDAHANGIEEQKALPPINTKIEPPIEPIKKSATMPLPNEVPPQPAGVIAHLTQALEAGIDQYAPTMVSSYLHGQPEDSTQADKRYDSSSSSETDSISDASFMSAEEMRRQSVGIPTDPSDSQLNLTSTPSIENLKQRKDLNDQEKKVLKLAERKDRLDRKLAQKRVDEESRLARAKVQDGNDDAKAQERYARELAKTEAKHKRDMEKLSAKQDKTALKAEEKRRKRDDRDNLSRVARERDEFREQVGLLRREMEILLEQMGDVQRENTILAARVGKLGGPEMLKSVRDEARSRAGSGASAGGRSRASTDQSRKS